MQRHDLPPENLRVPIWGGQIKHFSTEAFRALMECVLASESDAASAGAIELLDRRLRSFPDEADSLESLAWRALERGKIPLKDSDLMMAYRWNELAHRSLHKDPVRIARAAVWAEVASRLMSRGRGNMRLHPAIREWA